MDNVRGAGLHKMHEGQLPALLGRIAGFVLDVQRGRALVCACLGLLRRSSRAEVMVQQVLGSRLQRCRHRKIVRWHLVETAEFLSQLI